MAPVAIAFGTLLVVLGGGLFGLSDPEKRSFTAFIPSGFGVLLIVAGVIARDDKKRKHAMHLAAAVGLLGFAFPLGRVLMKVVRADPEKPFNALADGGQLAMSALCGVFVALCVKSFIDARKARKQAEAAR